MLVKRRMNPDREAAGPSVVLYVLLDLIFQSSSVTLNYFQLDCETVTNGNLFNEQQHQVVTTENMCESLDNLNGLFKDSDANIDINVNVDADTDDNDVENDHSGSGRNKSHVNNEAEAALDHCSSQLVHMRCQPQLQAMRSRCSAMELVHTGGGRRSMWGELPEVIHSGILSTISLEEKKLQEALFEVVSSEASYLKSLNILISHFVQSPRLHGPEAIISKRDHRMLFSDILPVRQTSERFLADLEHIWQESVLLDGICKVVRTHAEHNFQVYVKYCSNQVYQDRILKKLILENSKFVETLRELESSPICQSLNMHSYLMLPMQRITRLPLLITAIHGRLDRQSDNFNTSKVALDTLNKLVKECNKAARNMERMEEMLILSQQLDFREVRRALPLISASRWLVKRGEIIRIWCKDQVEAKLTFGRKINRQTLSLFLFTDLLVICKRKSEDNFMVIDHCPRNLVTLADVDSSDYTSLLSAGSSAKNLSEASQQHLSLLTLLRNHDGKTIEWLVSFGLECDRLRWLEAISPPKESSNPDEKIYESWDHLQVEAIRRYKAKDADDLSLKRGDKANVLQKLSNSGWCYIESQLNGHHGWISMIVAWEIESNHVRARNFKQRHAFLKRLATNRN